MATLSAEAAIEFLVNEPAKYSTPEALRNLAAQVATESPGRVTVLYSGPIGISISSEAIVNGMITQGEEIRVINRTHAADFLSSLQLRTAVADAFGVGIRDIDTRGTPANDFLYHPTKGLWADASARFVGGATGDVRIVAPFADYSRTLTQVELLKILETPEVTRINGVSKEVFQSIFDKTGSIIEVGKAVSASSYSLMGEMGEMGFHSYIEANADGTPKLNSDGSPRILIDKVDSTNLFKGLSYEGISVPANELNTSARTVLEESLSSERATVLGEGWRNLGIGAKAVVLTEGVFKGLGVLGVGVTAYQITELADQAQAAYERGDVGGASKIIADGSLQIAGGWAGGIAATAFAAGFFSPLLPTGPAGDVLYLVLVGGSGIGGAVLGENAVKTLLEAVSGNSADVTTELWKTTEYANGVVVREQTHSPYADDPTAEMGAVRFGSEWVRYSKEVTIPGENATSIRLWYGKSGIVRWVYDQGGNQIEGSKTIGNSDGGTTTVVLNASGEFVSSTTVLLLADGGRTLTTSYADQSLHTVKYDPPTEAQLLTLHTGAVREVSDVTLSDDGQRFTVTRDGSGLLLQTSTLTTYEDGSTSETVRYSDGRTIR
ncbi:MAG TPA: hypothetical protein PLX65_13690, partial [Accumulibacter sp.]|nr:hypothetical protein [Accumulibacter sp.]